MIDLSTQPRLKFIDVFDLSGLLATIVDHSYNHIYNMRYMQFFVYTKQNGNRFIDAVILNEKDRELQWWKNKIESQYKNVEWLHDTYEIALAQFNELQHELLKNNFHL